MNISVARSAAFIFCLVFAKIGIAQSNNPADNKAYMEKTISELSEYVGNKCGDFKVDVKFDETGFDYNTNPTVGTPTNADRAMAVMYGIAGVCEKGDAPSKRIKSKFTTVRIKQGGSNAVSLSGKTLEVTYNNKGGDAAGKLRDQYITLLNRL